MLVNSSNSALSAVTGAIEQASEATGTSFKYLLATAQVESGLNAKAGAATSSARGLFQFIETTWLATMKQAGSALGLGRYADAITQTPSGNYEVRDPAMRSEILKLRSDPAANAMMAGAFTKNNASALSERLGREPSEGELYIAHFLGVGGGARLIELAANNPSAKAADYFPGAAQANPSIFYDRSTGAARSLAQVRDVLVARYDVARGGQDSTAAPADPAVAAITTASANTGANASATAAAPDTAGIASAFAAAIPARKADDTQVFHGLFADDHRTVPLASMMGTLWATSNTAASGDGASASNPNATRMLNLFRDLPAASS
jgi:Transglycosylase SLT domain